MSLIGFGTFGQFMAPHLTPHFEVFAWNRTDYSQVATKLGVKWASIEQALQKEIIIIGTNINYFEIFLSENGAYFNPNALVIDVASVKIKPIELMLKHLPQTCEIIGTHPLFGPQSGKDGIKGLNFVLCPVRTVNESCIYEFLINKLQLNVLLRTPEEHDKQMAYVQALTHFIARAVANMDVPDSDQKTRAYERLLDIKGFLGGDSYDLFKSIENDNPFAETVRERFLSELNALNIKLKQDS